MAKIRLRIFAVPNLDFQKFNKKFNNMHRIISCFVLFLMAMNLSMANTNAKGHNFRIKLDNYPEKKLVLGFYFGDKTYVKDTADLGPDGYFSFKADTLLPCGVYLLVLMPDNNFIQLIISQNNQEFTMTTDAKEVVEKTKFKGSDDNAVFYDYLRYLGTMRPEADTIKAQLARAKGNAKDSIRLTENLEVLDKKVKKYQADLIKKYAGSMVAKIVSSPIEPEIPIFDEKGLNEEQKIMQKRNWYRDHYFDNCDIKDPCMMRTPIMHQKIEAFVQKFAVQHPDSISQAVDYILDKVKTEKDVYKFYLIHFLNYYAKSTFVGMDAVYVHIAKKYYCSGNADWAKKEDVEKICDNANRLEPILIGKIAPNITVMDRNNQPHALWDVDADYTVLFFWDPECSHCKKAAPFMVEFANKFKDRGVKVFAVCTAVTDKAPDCWKSAEEKGFNDVLFMNMYDPFLRSRYKTLYDIKTTPQIFILDRKHEILMKRISGEQLNAIN